jgi:hypothetical protein
MILTIAAGIFLGLLAFALLPQLLVIAVGLIIGVFFIVLMILAWHDPMLYPFPIIVAVIAGVALYTGCSGRCDRNRKENARRIIEWWHLTPEQRALKLQQASELPNVWRAVVLPFCLLVDRI